MSIFRPGGQFDDAEDESANAEQKLQGELDLARVTAPQASAATRLTAASRLGLNFTPALARAAADRNTSSADATASYLSLLQNASNESHASPYYQRQTYQPNYFNGQNPYASLPTTAEAASLAYARRASSYTGYPSGKAPETTTPPDIQATIHHATEILHHITNVKLKIYHQQLYSTGLISYRKIKYCLDRQFPLRPYNI